MDFFNLSQCPSYSPRAAFELTSDEFYRVLKSYQLEESLSEANSGLIFEEPSMEDFKQSFREIMNLISQGQIHKAVPVVFAKSRQSMTLSLKVNCLLHLLSADASLFPFGFWHQGQGLLGATPEILFELDNKKLKTMALAGTLAKGLQATGADLLRSQKDLKEHHFVSADILNVLKPLGEVKYFGPSVLDLPQLFHLLTQFQVDLFEQVDPIRLVHALHPTPALGVAPRVYGWRWLQQLPEQKNRGFFGAPVLFQLGQGKALCLVAIRQVQWDESSLRLGSGCGIVKESDLEKEWEELANKRESVRKLLGI